MKMTKVAKLKEFCHFYRRSPQRRKACREKIIYKKPLRTLRLCGEL